MLRKLYYRMPVSWRLFARRMYYLPLNTLDAWTGRRPALTPPRGLIFVGSGDFRKQGEDMLRQCCELTGLQPHHAVLDIGCGIGRLAVALTTFLENPGFYRGFDPMRTGIDWCNKHIGKAYPHFQFDWIPLNNDLYTQQGADARHLQFPYPDASFDRIYLFSVFTHMLPDEIHRYWQEIARVLKPKGQCLATCFVWDPEWEQSPNPSFPFPYGFQHYRLMDKQVVSANVALTDNWLMDSVSGLQPRPMRPGLGLQVLAKHPGYWAGRNKNDCQGFQDIWIVVKK